MASFNKVILIGNMTADPELKQTTGGISVCSFTIAVNRRFAKADQGQQNVDFINIVTWRQQAEFVSRYFKKGSSIVICGSIQTRSWTDDKGQKRYATEVVAEEAGVNRMEVTRYIRLTYLIPELLGLVDGKALKVTTAVELSYLIEDDQRRVLESGIIPSLEQAKKLREEFFELTPTQKSVSFSLKTFRPYFPKEYTTEQIIERIIKLLEAEANG